MDPAKSIHQAVRQGNAVLTIAALEKWPIPYIHARDEHGNTPLHSAASASKTDIVQLLLDHGAHPLSRNAARATPLHVASTVNSIDVVKALLKRASDPTLLCGNDDCLTIVSRMGYLDLVDVFLHEHPWTYQRRWEALLEALLHFHLDVVDKFREHGLSIHAKNSHGSSFLHAASSNDKHLKTTRYLLTHGVDVNGADARGARPLHLAAFQNSPQSVAELLAAGADPNALDVIDSTPVFPAIQQCDVISLEHLLAAGSSARDVVCLGPKRRPLLHVAAQGQKSAAEMARLLVTHGADPAARDEAGDLATKWAAQKGHLDLLRYFHELAFIVSSSDVDLQKALLSACLAGHLECAAFLVSIGADCNTANQNGDTPLVAAVQEGHLDVVAFLLERGAENPAALGCAIRKENANAVRLLLPHYLHTFKDTYAEVESYIETAPSANNYALAKELVQGVADVTVLSAPTRNDLLLSAASDGNVYLAKRLLKTNVTRSNCERASLMTPIHIAAYFGHIEMISLLAEAGFPISSETQFGESALHLAAKNGHVAVVRELNATISNKSKDKSGRCPIHWAAGGGHSKCVKLLIDFGSYIDPLDNNLQTPLQFAVEKGHVDCVRTLLSCGSDPGIVNMFGRTCVHLASLHDRYMILELLLPQSADMLDLRDSLGFTALHLAGSQPVTKLLRDNGTRVVSNESLNISAMKAVALSDNVWLVKELLSLTPHLNQSKTFIMKMLVIRPENSGCKVFEYLLGLEPGLKLLEDRQLISLLADCISDIDESRILALLRAIFRSQRKLPRRTAERVLVMACNRGFLSTVRLLAEVPGAVDFDVQGWSPLLIACKQGHLEVVESLLESGAKPFILSQSPVAIEADKINNFKLIEKSLEEYLHFQRARASA